MDQTRSPYTGPPARTVVVQSSGTIQAAINSITDASASKRYVVLVYPGTYTGQITMKAYVDVIGIDPRTCIISYTGGAAGAHTVTLASHCALRNLSVLGRPTTTVGNPQTAVIYGTGVTDIDILDNVLQGGDYNVWVAGLGNARLNIQRNTLSAPNPIFVASGDNPLANWATDVTIVDNAWSFSGKAWACHAFADVCAQGGLIAGNHGMSANTNTATPPAGQADVPYGIAVGGSKIVVKDNDLYIIDARRQSPTCIEVYPTDTEVAEANRIVIVGNNITIDTTYASGITVADDIHIYPTASVNKMPAIEIGENNFSIRYASLAGTRCALRVADNPTTGIVPTSTGVARIDARFARGRQLDMRYFTVTWMNRSAAASAPQNQLLVDVAAADADGLVDGAHASDYDFTGFGVPDLTVRALDHFRCLQVTSAADGGGPSGTLYIDGITWGNVIVRESFALAGAGVKHGSIPMLSEVGISVSEGATALIDIGWNDKLGLYKPIAATADVLGVSKNAAAKTLTGYTVDATNSTVAVDAGITANDDFEIWYNGLTE